MTGTNVIEAETMFEFGEWEVLGFNPQNVGVPGLVVKAISFFDSGDIDYVDGTSEESYTFTQSAESPYEYTGIDLTSCEQNKLAWNMYGGSFYATSYYNLQQVSYDPSTQTTVFNVLYWDESEGQIHSPSPFQMLFSYMKTPPNVYAPPNGSVVFTRNIDETTFNVFGSPPTVYGPFTFIGGPNNDGYYFSKISNYSFNRDIKDYFNGT